MRTKSEERRQHILDTAYDVYREMGFEAASMSLIATRVGGSKATLYNYFPTKENLFVEVMLAVAQRLKREAFCSFDKELSFPEKLQEFGTNYLAFILSPEMLAMRRIAVGQAGHSDIGVQVYERGMKVGWTKVATQLDNAMKNGDLRDAEPWMTAMHFKALLEAGLSEPGLLGVPQDTSKIRLTQCAHFAVDIFLRAYTLR